MNTNTSKMETVLVDKDKKRNHLRYGKFPDCHRFPFTDGPHPTQNIKNGHRFILNTKNFF